MAFSTTFVALAIGTPAAYALVRLRQPGYRAGDKFRFSVEARHLMFFDSASGQRIDLA
jgi:ABC-type glycerol-3-phosphate transport system permease component